MQRGASQIVHYGRRFTLEETFRDTKDLHVGMDLHGPPNHVHPPILCMLGAASEPSEWDKYLKPNTSKQRTHSL